MKNKIPRFAVMLAVMTISLSGFTTLAQVANFANFTPVRMTIERMDAADTVEQGVFVRFSSDIGRVYRLEASSRANVPARSVRRIFTPRWVALFQVIFCIGNQLGSRVIYSAFPSAVARITDGVGPS